MFKIITKWKRHSSINVVVYLSWIPAHCGVQANEEIDKLTRAVANDINKSRVSALSFISLVAAF